MDEKVLKLVTDSFMPAYGSEEAAGLDLYCNNEDPILVGPGETVKVPTGLRVEIPEGFFGGVYPRSSTGVKKHLFLANTIGVIDSDYRGELQLFFYNYGNESVVIQKGDRLAQLIIQPYLKVKPVKVDKLSDSKRGEGGFGSTGR